MKQSITDIPTILAVDDDPQVLAAYREILIGSDVSGDFERFYLEIGEPEEKDTVMQQQSQFHLVEAEGGEEALAQYQQLEAQGVLPAVALIDMRMPPGMNGLETALELRKRDSLIYILIISAYSDIDNQTIQLALQHDFTFLNKPVDHKELYQLVENATRRFEAAHKNLIQKGVDGVLSGELHHRELILVVDDSKAVCALAAATLGRYLQVDVEVANSGEEAFQRISEQMPDLILLDICMPEMSGIEVCKALKASASTQDIPVLFLSADTEEETILSGFKAGAVDYIFKPFSPQVVVARISSQLDLRRKNQKLELVSRTDVLTELPNRMAFDALLSIYISGQPSDLPGVGQARGDERNPCFALLFIDLDHFKPVNDQFGHEVGDQLLKAVAERMRQNLREGDLVARIGGDEFVALLMGVETIEDAGVVANKLISILGKEFSIGEHLVQIGATIGSVRFPFDSAEKNELMRYADMAMYAAKEQGRNIHLPFTSTLKQQIGEREDLIAALWSAIKQEQLFLKFQPKVRLRGHRVDGLDALLRWSHPEKGEVSACDFIHQLMQGELGLAAERYIQEMVFRHLIQYGESTLPVSVNLSEYLFKNEQLDDYFTKIASDLGVELALFSKLEVDIEERLLIQYPELSIKKIAQLNQIGVRIYVDQFGASTVMLTDFDWSQINGIKLARKLIGEENTISQQKVKLAASISKIYGVPLIAVGVETEGQLKFLESVECEGGIGYYLHKPMKAEELSCIAVPV